MKNKTLKVIALGIPLSLVSCGGDYSESFAVEKRLSEKETQTFMGKIIHIDEEVIGVAGFHSIGTFSFEYIRMRGKDLEERRFVVPQPTDYRVDDVATIKYYPIKKISFEEFIRDYGNNFPLDNSRMNQPGFIEGDGVIIK